MRRFIKFLTWSPMLLSMPVVIFFCGYCQFQFPLVDSPGTVFIIVMILGLILSIIILITLVYPAIDAHLQGSKFIIVWLFFSTIGFICSALSLLYLFNAIGDSSPTITHESIAIESGSSCGDPNVMRPPEVWVKPWGKNEKYRMQIELPVSYIDCISTTAYRTKYLVLTKSGNLGYEWIVGYRRKLADEH